MKECFSVYIPKNEKRMTINKYLSATLDISKILGAFCYVLIKRPQKYSSLKEVDLFDKINSISHDRLEKFYLLPDMSKASIKTKDYYINVSINNNLLTVSYCLKGMQPRIEQLEARKYRDAINIYVNNSFLKTFYIDNKNFS